MDIVGFDFYCYFIQRQRVVGSCVDGLWLNIVQYCCVIGFKQIVMCGLIDNIFFVMFVVIEQSDQVGLSVGWQKNGGFFIGKFCGVVLQSINGRVVFVNVVFNWGGYYCFEYGVVWLGNGIIV